MEEHMARGATSADETMSCYTSFCFSKKKLYLVPASLGAFSSLKNPPKIQTFNHISITSKH